MAKKTENNQTTVLEKDEMWEGLHKNLENSKNKKNSKKSKKPDKRGGFFLNSPSVGGLVLRCVILLLIPYAYLLLCGLVFDKWLKLYRMTPFIFYSLIVLYVIAIVVIILAIVRFVRTRRRK